MEKIKNIVLKIKDDEGHLNNAEFVNVSSLFYKNLLLANSKIINELLGHEANKVIILKLYNLSKPNGNIIYIIHIVISIV